MQPVGNKGNWGLKLPKNISITREQILNECDIVAAGGVLLLSTKTFCRVEILPHLSHIASGS